MFFVYLAIKSGEAGSFSGIIEQGMQNIVSANGFGGITFTMLTSSIGMLIQFLSVVGILFGGLIVAQKLGVYGAEGAMKMAKGIGTNVGKWPAKRARMALSGRAGKIGRGISKAGAKMEGSRLAKYSGLGYLTKQLGRAPTALEERERADFAESEKKYKDWTTDNLKTERKAASPRDKSAIDTILAKRKDGFKGSDDEEMEDMIKLAKRYGKEDDIIKARPDLAHLAKDDIDRSDPEQVKAAIKEAVLKLKSKDIENVQAEAYGKEGERTDEQQAVVDSFKEGFEDPHSKIGKQILVKAADENPALSATLIKEIIEPKLNQMKPEIQEYYKVTTGKGVTGEPEVVTSASGADFKEATSTLYKGK